MEFRVVSRAAAMPAPRRAIVALDALAVVAAHLAMLLFRFEGEVSARYWWGFGWTVPLIAATYVIANLVSGSYRIEGTGRILLGWLVAVSTWVILIGYLLRGFRRPIPLSVVVLGAVFSLIGFVVIHSVASALRRRPSTGRDSREGGPPSGRRG